MDVPQHEIEELKRRLRGIEQWQKDFDNKLDDRMELAIRRYLSNANESRRSMASWVIGLIAFALFILFGLADLILQLGA